MKEKDYKQFYDKIFKTLGDLTPLKADCGQLCEGACCKGDEDFGMRLFPHEESYLNVRELEDGGRLAVCDGTCNRDERPLACRIFPFFPTIDEEGEIFVEPDPRARNVCPLVVYIDDIVFDQKFFKALEKVGKLLAKDEECREFLYRNTEEIDMFNDFLFADEDGEVQEDI